MSDSIIHHLAPPAGGTLLVLLLAGLCAGPAPAAAGQPWPLPRGGAENLDGETWPDGYDSLSGGRVREGAAPRLHSGRGSSSGEGQLALARTPLTDEAVIAQVLAGDGRAFEELVERHQAQVVRIVAGKVPRQEAPEVAQEVFVRAYLSLSGYKPIKPFSHWLSTLAVRACHDYWRAQYRRREVPMSDLAPAPGSRREVLAEAALAGEAADDYKNYEDWELLDWALGHLSPGDRMALTLVHLEGYSLAEAAEALGWSQTMVKVRAFRARRKLHQLITQSLSGEVKNEASHS